MKLTLNQAAKECGRAKSTLSKAIKSGKLSAEVQEGGAYHIDPAELFRVFPKQDEQQKEKQRLLTANPTKQQENNTLPVSVHLELIEVKAKLESMEAMQVRLEAEISDLRHQRDDWKEQAKTLLISNQNRAQAAPEKARRGFLGLFGRHV